jgi:hypothetical protein
VADLRQQQRALFKQLQTLPPEPLPLPPPCDERAVRLTALCRARTGLPLGAWRRRLRLQTALETLAQGESVAEAAARGYRGASWA